MTQSNTTVQYHLTTVSNPPTTPRDGDTATAQLWDLVDDDDKLHFIFIYLYINKKQTEIKLFIYAYDSVLIISLQKKVKLG